MLKHGKSNWAVKTGPLSFKLVWYLSSISCNSIAMTIKCFTSFFTVSPILWRNVSIKINHMIAMINIVKWTMKRWRSQRNGVWNAAKICWEMKKLKIEMTVINPSFCIVWLASWNIINLAKKAHQLDSFYNDFLLPFL